VLIEIYDKNKAFFPTKYTVLSETIVTFEDYLAAKKIDAKALRIGIKAKYLELENHYSQMHPKSFTDQYLYLINGYRRSYPFQLTKN
jgi:hypothetical protein